MAQETIDLIQSLIIIVLTLWVMRLEFKSHDHGEEVER